MGELMGLSDVREHPLLNLVTCPRTGSELEPVKLDQDVGLISKKDGALYPIINNIVVTEPVSPQLEEECTHFMNRNSSALEQLKDRYNPSLTEQVLFSFSRDEALKWHRDEMAYWETRFKNRIEGKEIENPGWNRTLPRWKVLRKLPSDLNKKIILEIGCGSSHTLHDVFGSDVPNYIGSDLSINACRLTQKVFPDGLYVQALAEKIPLAKNSVDVLVAYGVFHHIPGHEENILSLLPILKPGGYIIGADPLMKPRIPRPGLSKNKHAHENSQESSDEIDLRSGRSPYNEWIDWDNLRKITQGKAEVVRTYYEYSPLRTVMVAVLFNRLGIRGLAFTRMMLALDRLWLMTVGKMHKAIGPAAIHYVIQKKDSQ